MSISGPAAVNWCFTINNPTHVPVFHDKMQYLVYQFEKGKKEGTRHIQGYVQFKTKQRMVAIKKILNDKTAHLEVSRGSPQQNKEYCTKAETRVDGPFEFGEMVSQGRRTDLAVVAERIVKEKVPVHTVAIEHPETYVRYHSGIEKLHYHVHMEAAQAFRKVCVIILHGSAGSGKTRLMYDLLDPMLVYKMNTSDQKLWFDGYEGQPVFLLDDYYGWIKYGEFLVLLDGHPYRLPIKGGHTWAFWSFVVITSNKHPSEWYHEINDAFLRRISHVFEFPKDKDYAISAIRSEISQAGIPLKRPIDEGCKVCGEQIDSSSNRE